MAGVSFSFGDSPEMADWLLGLVLAGKKTATCGAVRDFGPHEPMPEVGRRDTVLDGRGRPAAVIQTISVRRAPISDVELDFVLAEGEGDRSIEEWLENHGRYFARNGGFSRDMEVIFERFRLVEVLPRLGYDFNQYCCHGWRPGLTNAIAKAYARCYARDWGYGRFFGAKVSRECGEFMNRAGTEDLIVSCWDGEVFRGALIIDTHDPAARPGEAHLRWFIVNEPSRRPGGRLMLMARDFLDDRRLTCFLTTHLGMDPARRFYERLGFRLVSAKALEQWGVSFVEQRLERRPNGGPPRA